MKKEKCPVVLVHGWRSTPAIWSELMLSLSDNSTYWNFDHTNMKGASSPEIAHSLERYMHAMRDSCGYHGPVDMVCHSMGTGIARYLLEVIDGKKKEENVRQLIALGPPNNGSSIAELFCDPGYGPLVLKTLAGVFVPRRFDPEADTIVQEFRPNSQMMSELKAAGIRKDIAYRIIMTSNITSTADFFPCFEGKTWEISPKGGWQTTFAGDGIVSHSDSFLPGAGADILPADPGRLKEDPMKYCHLHLPKNPEVIAKVGYYLTNPLLQSPLICQEEKRRNE